MVVFYIASRFFLLSSFEKLEKQDVVLNVLRVLNTLSNDIAALSSNTADWASCDETCSKLCVKRWKAEMRGFDYSSKFFGKCFFSHSGQYP